MSNETGGKMTLEQDSEIPHLILARVSGDSGELATFDIDRQSAINMAIKLLNLARILDDAPE